MTAQQGHLYQHGTARVLALSSGASVRVAVVEPGQPWLGNAYQASARWLTPLPMRYFHGELPA